MHRVWKDRLVEKLRPRPGQRHLDVAGGTGDVAFRVLEAMRQAQHSGSSSSFASSSSSSGGAGQPAAADSQQAEHQQQQAGAPPLPLPSVTVCDINAAMLAEGRRKAEGQGIGPESMQWVEGNAEELPFDSGVFDSYTVAFGIRNVTDRPAALREAYRWGWAEAAVQLPETACAVVKHERGSAAVPAALAARPSGIACLRLWVSHVYFCVCLQGAAAGGAPAVPRVFKGGGPRHAAAVRPLLIQRHPPNRQVRCCWAGC